MILRNVELPYGLSKPQQSPEDRRSEKDQHRDGNYIDSITQGETVQERKGVKHQKMHTLRNGRGEGEDKNHHHHCSWSENEAREAEEKPEKI